jgi:hypothetical protein
VNRSRWWRARPSACLLLTAGLAVACGKKGPPLAPLPRVPAAVGEFAAIRRHDTVLISYVVPTANVAGDTPADVAAVEVYAVTGTEAPALTGDTVPPPLTLVTTTRVRRPLPPLPPDEAAKVPPMPREPGAVDQGERVTITERLSTEVRLPSAVPAAPASSAGPSSTDLTPPLVFVPDGEGIRRHYVAVAVGRGGRRSAWSAVKSVPVAEGPAAPVAPAVTHDATTLTLTWTPAPGARVAAAEPDDGLLPSRPFGPPATPTRYNVYAASASGAPEDAASATAPLNAEPIAPTSWSTSGVAFGQERCFAVRALDVVDGVDIEGPASAPACVIPRDTFPPAAPAALDAVGGLGVVSLIWDRVEEADVAGYLVFRGLAPGEPDTLLTPAPIVASSFEDRTVAPGVRYVYVVVAVDSATPPNRSAPSNRAEGAARQ